MNSEKVNYMLRRVLPTWKPQETIDEVTEFCLKNHIDEVMWIDESSGSFHGILTLPEVKERTVWLNKAGKCLRQNGIKHSINVMTSMGHGDYGEKTLKRHPGLELFVDYDGNQSKSCACPLSPVWRKAITETYRIYATTQPVRLWVEDDFRCFGHGAAGFGCCCKRHLAEFGRRIGRKFSLIQLKKSIFKSGVPHPWRKLWLHFQEECMIRVAEMIRDAVDEISPSTQMGWMSTAPFLTELEGRSLGSQIKAFAGNKTAAIRMTTTQYCESNPRWMLIEDEALKKGIYQLPRGTVRCTEIEAMPDSLYTKSAKWLEAQMTWGCVLNVPNQTLNIYDFLGTPMSLTPNLSEMLRMRKNTLESIASEFCGDVTFRGIGLLSHPYAVNHVHTTEGKSILELMSKETGWADVLRGFGIPVVCSDTEDVSAITGQAFRRFDQEEILKIFSKGVLLDLSALRVLDDMGLLHLAGVSLNGEFGQRSRPVGVDSFTDPDFGGGWHHFSWTYALSDTLRIGILEPMKGAKVISSILDNDLKPIVPGAILYENEIGGKVAVFPHDFSGKDPDTYVKGARSFFYSEYRREQIQSIIRWLGKDSLPLLVRANGWVLPHRSDTSEKILFAAMNLNYDDWREVGFECSTEKKIKRVRVMNPNGIWREQTVDWEQNGGVFKIKIRENVRTLGLIAAALDLKDS